MLTADVSTKNIAQSPHLYFPSQAPEHSWSSTKFIFPICPPCMQEWTQDNQQVSLHAWECF